VTQYGGAPLSTGTNALHGISKAGEVRLEPGTRTNDEGRVFPFTKELRRVIEAQRHLADQLQRDKEDLERSGVSRSLAMKLTRHKTEAVYRRYAIVSNTDLRDAVRRLEDGDTSGDTQGSPEHAVKPNSRNS
jgi:hypothetical protein